MDTSSREFLNSYEYYAKHIAILPEEEIQKLYAPTKHVNKRTGEITYEPMSWTNHHNPDPKEVLPKWLMAMKHSMIEDAKAVEAVTKAAEERTAARLQMLQKAGFLLAPELSSTELNTVLDGVETMAGELRGCYAETICQLKYEMDAEGMAAAIEKDRSAAALLLKGGAVRGGQGGPERELPAEIMGEAFASSVLSAE